MHIYTSILIYQAACVPRQFHHIPVSLSVKIPPPLGCAHAVHQAFPSPLPPHSPVSLPLQPSSQCRRRMRSTGMQREREGEGEGEGGCTAGSEEKRKKGAAAPRKTKKTIPGSVFAVPPPHKRLETPSPPPAFHPVYTTTWPSWQSEITPSSPCDMTGIPLSPSPGPGPLFTKDRPSRSSRAAADRNIPFQPSRIMSCAMMQ